jgi:hypothetical protein
MNVLLTLFLLLPPLILFVKEVRRWQVSLQDLFGVYVLIGWGLIIVAERMQYGIWQVSNSAQVFMTYLGWIYSAVYFLIWMIAAYIIRQFRKQLATGTDLRV